MFIQFGTSGWRAVIADEFIFADSNGSFNPPNQLIALLFDYFVESRQWSGSAARSVATSPLVDRVAETRGLPIYETPVGFKYIGELINENKIVSGGEESAGLSIQGYYPEKDGILARLFAAEAVAAGGTSLTEQLNELYARVGKLEAGRNGTGPNAEIMKALPDKRKHDPKEIGGRRSTAPIGLMVGSSFLSTAPGC
jgi:phosphomannomutase